MTLEVTAEEAEAIRNLRQICKVQREQILKMLGRQVGFWQERKKAV